MTEQASTPNWWDLEDTRAWRTWREQYLSRSPIQYTPVAIRNPTQLSASEIEELSTRVQSSGVALYRTEPDPGEEGLLALGAQLGLQRIDHHQCAEPSGVAHLRAQKNAVRQFIPYTNRRLRWHTDGYYQNGAAPIRSFLLHCVRPARKGGRNRLLDPRSLYIALRDENPEHIAALSNPNVFEVPAFIEHGIEKRPAYQGSVFALDDGHLYMRYTERGVNIHWHKDAKAALVRVRELLDELPQAQRKLKLESGCGLIAHNVLHCRSAFTDASDTPRLLYRIRYHDRVTVPC